MTVVDVLVAPAAGGIAAPTGFRAAGVSCGIKKAGLDLALLVADKTASAAAVFTTNKAQAAPILVSKANLAAGSGQARAVVINSGCANACTGEEGMETARAMAAAVGAQVGCTPADVLVASTGVIGVTLNRAAVVSGIAEAAAA